jgi:hypothetical protein
VPETDAAWRWAFARVKADGELGLFLDSHGNGDELLRLETEFERQREMARVGARTAET